MPVYYEEKDERVEFIKKIISDSSAPIDCGCFASYLYRDVSYNPNKFEYTEYEDVMFKIQRQFPRTEEHAFRDETKNSIFNLVKIYEQIDYNEGNRSAGVLNIGNFQWINGVKDTKVTFNPDPKGRFKVSWVHNGKLQNNVILKNVVKYTGNEHM